MQNERAKFATTFKVTRIIREQSVADRQSCILKKVRA